MRRILLSAALAGSLVVTGCANGNGETSDTVATKAQGVSSTTTPGQFGNACSALSPDQVQVLLGTTAGGNPPTNDNGKNQSTCTWTGSGTKVLIVQLGNNNDYQQSKAQFPEATLVPGVGKDGFVAVAPQSLNGGALSLNGLQSVLLTYPGGTQSDVAVFTKLLQQAADTLGRNGGPQFNENPPPVTNANGTPVGPGN